MRSNASPIGQPACTSTSSVSSSMMVEATYMSGFNDDVRSALVAKNSSMIASSDEYFSSIARRKAVAGSLLDWSILTTRMSFFVTSISSQLPRSGITRQECKARSPSAWSLMKSTPGDRWSCETITRSAPLMMNSPPPIMIGMSPR